MREVSAAGVMPCDSLTMGVGSACSPTSEAGVPGAAAPGIVLCGGLQELAVVYGFGLVPVDPVQHATQFLTTCLVSAANVRNLTTEALLEGKYCHTAPSGNDRSSRIQAFPNLRLDFLNEFPPRTKFVIDAQLSHELSFASWHVVYLLGSHGIPTIFDCFDDRTVIVFQVFVTRDRNVIDIPRERKPVLATERVNAPIGRLQRKVCKEPACGRSLRQLVILRDQSSC